MRRQREESAYDNGPYTYVAERHWLTWWVVRVDNETGRRSGWPMGSRTDADAMIEEIAAQDAFQRTLDEIHKQRLADTLSALKRRMALAQS